MAYKNCPMCTRYDYCMEDGRVCGVTEKLMNNGLTKSSKY